MRGRNTPSTSVKPPPMTIFPSACSAIDVTASFVPKPGSNVGSMLPSLFSRAIPPRRSPPKLLKLPPTRIRPSACTASADTHESAPWPGSKPGSTLLSLFSRATRILVEPFTFVKSPAMRMSPPGRIFERAQRAIDAGQAEGRFRTAVSVQSRQPRQRVVVAGEDGQEIPRQSEFSHHPAPPALHTAPSVRQLKPASISSVGFETRDVVGIARSREIAAANHYLSVSLPRQREDLAPAITGDASPGSSAPPAVSRATPG